MAGVGGGGGHGVERSLLHALPTTYLPSHLPLLPTTHPTPARTQRRLGHGVNCHALLRARNEAGAQLLEGEDGGALEVVGRRGVGGDGELRPR